MSAPAGRYRWAVLAAGTFAAVTNAAVLVGLPALAPAIQDEYGLTLAQLGVVLSAISFGPLFTLLPWGMLADRIGERLVLASGLGASGLVLVAAAYAPGFASLAGVLALAGAAGVSVNSASGRAVMSWFPAGERGLALGIRQAAIPVGGAAAALALPPVEAGAGLGAAFLVLAGACLVGALVGALVVRDRPGAPPEGEAEAVSALLDRRLWLLGASSGFYLVAQLAITGFVVLYLHDERGLSNAEAAAVLAAVQILAIGTRVLAGRWSDIVGSRFGPLRAVGVASALSLGVATALLGAPLWLLVPAFAAAGAISMSWNGLSFAAAAELAGYGRSGAAIGFQQTVLAGVAVVVPAGFAAAVSSTSWRASFAAAAASPLAGWLLLRRRGE